MKSYREQKKVHKYIPVLSVGFLEVEKLLREKAHNKDKGEDSVKKENIVKRFGEMR